jgi:hypothetical protein
MRRGAVALDALADGEAEVEAAAEAKAEAEVEVERVGTEVGSAAEPLLDAGLGVAVRAAVLVRLALGVADGVALALAGTDAKERKVLVFSARHGSVEKSSKEASGTAKMVSIRGGAAVSGSTMLIGAAPKRLTKLIVARTSPSKTQKAPASAEKCGRRKAMRSWLWAVKV